MAAPEHSFQNGFLNNYRFVVWSKTRLGPTRFWSPAVPTAPYTDLVNGHYAARPLPCSLQGPNVGRIPEGCQMVAGGRPEAAERTTTGKRVMDRLHPRGMPDRPLGPTRRDRKQCPRFITHDSPRASGIPPGWAAFVIRCSGGRFSQEDARPP